MELLQAKIKELETSGASRLKVKVYTKNHSESLKMCSKLTLITVNKINEFELYCI
jgi:hypothetical protein